MAFENLFIRVKRSLAGVRLDGVVRENHDNPIRITKNPIELGADISDHAIIEPVKINIEGVVTDTPLGIEFVNDLIDKAQDIFGSSTSNGVTRSQQAYNSLIVIKNQREPIDIQTGLKLYESMLITNIRVSQDKGTSQAVFLFIDAEEVIITETELISLPASQLEVGDTTSQAQSNASRGRQETEELGSDSVPKQSALKSIIGWAF